MYVLTYALKSIQRSWMRNLLIGFVVFVVAFASVISLMIRNAADDMVTMQEDNFEITANVSVDRNLVRSTFSNSTENMRTLMGNVVPLELEDLQYYANSEYVKDLNYNLAIDLNSEALRAVGEEEVEEDSRLEFGSETETGSENKSGSNSMRGQFKLNGYTSAESIDSFVSGEYKMIEGSVYDLFASDMHGVLITDELAEINDLQMGDWIELNGNDLQVTGIYIDEGIESDSWFSDAANQIITDYQVADKIRNISTEEGISVLNAQLNHTFYLHDGQLLEEFRQEVAGKGLDSFYVLRSNYSEFERAMQPFANLISFSSLFLGLVLGVGGLILLTINMINIRERKYEIGVLRAMGMKKGAVSMQFLVELLVVTLSAMLIGLIAGSALSQPVGNHILANEIQQLQAEQELIQSNMGAPSGSGSRNNQQTSIVAVDYISEIHTPIDKIVMLQVMLIGILVVLLGSMISLITISRYEPLKILSSRT